MIGECSHISELVFTIFYSNMLTRMMHFYKNCNRPCCSSMHCFEGPEWKHLKRGRESFARGPLVKVDPQGRCGGVLVYGLQMIVLKAFQVCTPY